MPTIGRSAAVLSATAAAVLALAAPAAADHAHGENLLRAALVGSNPAPASPAIAGIDPGAAPWVNGPSSVWVREDGRLRAQIRGLVIPGRGNPVLSAVVTLVCGGTVAGSTMPFMLSPTGDGAVRDRVPVPRRCEDPTVLIQPFANRSVYIASATGEDDD